MHLFYAVGNFIKFVVIFSCDFIIFLESNFLLKQQIFNFVNSVNLFFRNMCVLLWPNPNIRRTGNELLFASLLLDDGLQGKNLRN